MINSLLSLLLIFGAIVANAQSYPPTFRELKPLISGDMFILSQLAADSVGNTYWGGAFTSPTAAVGLLTVTNTPGVGFSEDACLFKFGSNFDERWAISGGGAGHQAISGLAVDAQRNCYFAVSSMQGTLRFDNLTFSSPSNEMTVVFKYSSGGKYIWSHQFNGVNTFAWSRRLSVDNDNNVFIGGVLNFFEDPSSANPSVVRKIGPNGNELWTRTGDKINASYSYGLQVDSSGNCFILSSFTNATVTFGATTLQNRGQQSYVLLKYDPEGTALWARRGGGNGPGIDRAVDLTVDKAGDVYVLSVIGSTNFLFGTNNLPVTPESWMLAKYGSDSQPIWARAFPTPEIPPASAGVSLDADGGILISASSAHGDDFSSGFLAKCSSDGDLIWKKQVRTRPVDDEKEMPGGAILWRTRPVVTRDNKIYVAGSPYQNLYVSLDSLVPESWFLAKLSYDPQLSTSRDGDWLTLSWPTNEGGFFLESSQHADGSYEWLAVTNPVVRQNGQYAVTNLIAETNQFYRLHKATP